MLRPNCRFKVNLSKSKEYVLHAKVYPSIKRTVEKIS